MRLATPKGSIQTAYAPEFAEACADELIAHYVPFWSYPVNASLDRIPVYGAVFVHRWNFTLQRLSIFLCGASVENNDAI